MLLPPAEEVLVEIWDRGRRVFKLVEAKVWQMRFMLNILQNKQKETREKLGNTEMWSLSGRSL